MSNDEKRQRFELVLENTEWGDYYTSLYDRDSDSDEPIGTDGGEPEDNTFGRDWAWVTPLLNELNEETIRARDVAYNIAGVADDALALFESSTIPSDYQREKIIKSLREAIGLARSIY